MDRVLWDTAALSYWLEGKEEFRVPLRKLQHDLRREKALLFVSTVTIQELAVVGLWRRNWDEMIAWILERFNPMPLTRQCAEEAAALQVAVGYAAKGTKSERREAKDLWFRDAAIVGTAMAEGLDMVVTTEKRFVAYENHYEGQIRVIEAIGATET